MPEVRLTRKFAEMIDGVDVSGARPGEELDVTLHEADLLVAEGWAEYVDARSTAEDKPPRRRKRKSPSF